MADVATLTDRYTVEYAAVQHVQTLRETFLPICAAAVRVKVASCPAFNLSLMPVQQASTSWW